MTSFNLIMHFNIIKTLCQLLIAFLFYNLMHLFFDKLNWKGFFYNNIIIVGTVSSVILVGILFKIFFGI